jgi:hypothetical protein
MAVQDKLSVPVNGENQGTIMPKLKHKFVVGFVGMANGDTSFATRDVVSVTRPTLSHDEIPIDVYNSTIYVAGKHKWDTVQIVLRDDVNNETSTLLDQQMAKQIDMRNQSSVKAASSYKFAINIDSVDGGNPDYEILDSWELYGCFIQNIAYEDSAYSSGSDFQKITITLRFDNAAHIVNGTDILSDPTFAADPSKTSNATI